jgi:hypothetical protein
MLYNNADPLPFLFSRPSVFLAGGVNNCEDWQEELSSLINTSLYDVVNPRSKNHSNKLEITKRDLMLWEHRAIDKSDSAIFWFPKNTVCPTALLELGRMLERAVHHSARLAVGWHPKYPRAVDVETLIQAGICDKKYIIHSGEGWEPLKEIVKKTWG